MTRPVPAGAWPRRADCGHQFTARGDSSHRGRPAPTLVNGENCATLLKRGVPIGRVPAASFVAELDKAWSLRERRLACPAPKAKSQRSSPRFHPAQVSQRCCHTRIHCRRPEGGSRSAARDSRELRLGPMRSGYLCSLGSGRGDHEVPQLHQAVARAGALFIGRRQFDGGEHEPVVARLQLPARQRRSALGNYHAKRPGSFCQDARSDAGFPCGARSGTGRQAGLGEGRGILSQQS